MIKRVNPTENAINGIASKVLASLARIVWVVELVKAKTRPSRGKPEGPGMVGRVLGWGIRVLDSAQARPPGKRMKEKMVAKKKRYAAS